MRQMKLVLEIEKEFKENFEGLPELWHGTRVS